jgi:hypothetical protein
MRNAQFGACELETIGYLQKEKLITDKRKLLMSLFQFILQNQLLDLLGELSSFFGQVFFKSIQKGNFL